MTEAEPDIIKQIRNQLPENWFYYALAVLGVLAVVAGLIWFFYKRRQSKK